MRKVTTGCCALCQIDQVNDNTSIKDLKSAIRTLKKQKDQNTEVGFTTGNGQTSVFVIASPGEDILKANLEKLGFLICNTFERRRGYPEGMLQMYILNF